MRATTPLSVPEGTLIDVRRLSKLLAECRTDAIGWRSVDDFGNLQVYREEDGVLEIARQRGFRSDFLQAFKVVSAKDPCACGRALETSNPIVVFDVEQDSEFAPYLSVARNAGYRAVQSFPMISTNGRVMGVLSTHFRTPGLPSPGKMHLTRLFARHAADVLAG